MRRILDIVTRIIYVLAGTYYLLLGIVVLLLGTGLLPVWVHDRIFAMGQNNPDTLHLIQEIGTLWVLVGILVFWFAWHLSDRFYWAMTFYLSLDAFVHWFSAYGKFENNLRALINAIPFFLFLVLGLLRRYGKYAVEIDLTYGRNNIVDESQIEF
jgi:hypothetical protein